ncbi:hypothetical protein P170DRAFT_455869 [Aspergillus steynii IBT 23096]|uniref:Xylanolytic transcriptional activator regulatory domain-containing protein n=1 Tax=Aspergillus steynii IBT 23096 TaxID=1392250 RepID=A0A2I2G8F3_9EURO|nr:uncharacterized protein P170DRAFT_455869 [Aspergillus steynii IBT 23096]PLB49123.1 hypothetical protein P170DRAFT_455869 [Aspergillus steynii IBT 23096]
MAMPHESNMSTFLFDQPTLQFSPIPLFDSFESHSVLPNTPSPEGSTPLLDEFTSTFPSFEPAQSARASQEPWKITQDIWNHLLAEIQSFLPVLPSNFVLPSRHTLTRYIATYFSGFHRHLPFLHIPTFSPTKCPVELLLAVATIGAQSAFDHGNAIMFYRSSLAIAQERLRHRKALQRERLFSATDTLSGWSGNQTPDNQFTRLSLAQTLLILMAMATWGNSEAIFNEAVGLQNTLTNYIREEKLLDLQPRFQDSNNSWQQWIQVEAFNRTIAIIYCFFVFHTIVYDTPPPILNSELDLHLPSREADWEAPCETDWIETRRKSTQPLPESFLFQSSFSSLFSAPTHRHHTHHEITYSSLGGYTLILALIQHIYFLRETWKTKIFGSLSSQQNPPLPQRDITEVEVALQNWQSAWYRDPESFLGPGSTRGPISFNSTALLRMAYIRLNVNLGPYRALTTHDPREIAARMHTSPPLAPSPRITRAVLYSAHALSIPVKIGVNIVARTQAFTWSLQHALCALECAFIVSRWLRAVLDGGEGGRTLDEEEVRLLGYIKDLVAEADPGGEFSLDREDLCARIVRVWAKLLSGEAVWDVVSRIGKALAAYAGLLEDCSAGRSTG